MRAWMRILITGLDDNSLTGVRVSARVQAGAEASADERRAGTTVVPS